MIKIDPFDNLIVRGHDMILDKTKLLSAHVTYLGPAQTTNDWLSGPDWSGDHEILQHIQSYLMLPFDMASEVRDILADVTLFFVENAPKY